MKPYGIRVTDVLGATYTRWFASNGSYVVHKGISLELVTLGNELDNMRLKRGIRHANAVCNRTSMNYEVLGEDEFKNNNK